MENNEHFNRRTLLKGTLALTAGMTAARASASQSPTPSQVEGPFYPITPQADTDLDLTRIKGQPDEAKGQKVWVVGQVTDQAGKPIANAVVDIWQANAAGRYAHPGDTNSAPLDPNFQGWGIVSTDNTGHYRFKTIKPGAYGVSGQWSRPPHIHCKVSKRGYHELTTQMYFAGEPLNENDGILNNVDAQNRGSLIVQFDQQDPFDAPVGQFNIVLQQV